MKEPDVVGRNYLWWIPAGMPLVIILCSFLSGGWFWGLMDDIGMVQRPGSIWERTASLISDLWGSGRFEPTTSFHWAVLYKIFANNPTGCYVFRWIEVIAVLGIWGLLAAQVVRKKWVVGLFFAVALGFLKLYDGFFYLSVTELWGVLLAAPAALFFCKAFCPVLDEGKPLNVGMTALAMLFVLLAMGAKETFVVLPAAIGMSAFIASFWGRRRRPVLIMALVLLLIAVFFIVFIKVFLVRGYSEPYSLSDFPKICRNLLDWCRKCLPLHAPWIVMGGVLAAATKRGRVNTATPSYLFAVLLGAFLYIGYSLIILPWSMWGYYVLPLGVFFAFLTTILIADRLDSASSPFWIVIFIMTLLLNVAMSSYVLRWYYTDQRDAQNMAEWMSQNAIFEHDIAQGATVRSNAHEPGHAIPRMALMRYGKKYEHFTFTSSVMEIVQDPTTRYYLWGKSWGNQDLRLLKDMWTPVFLSDHWIMFRRMY